MKGVFGGDGGEEREGRGEGVGVTCRGHLYPNQWRRKLRILAGLYVAAHLLGKQVRLQREGGKKIKIHAQF